MTVDNRIGDNEMYHVYDLFGHSEEDAQVLVGKLADRGIVAVAGKNCGENAVEFQTDQRLPMSELRALEALAPGCTLVANGYSSLD